METETQNAGERSAAPAGSAIMDAWEWARTEKGIQPVGTVMIHNPAWCGTKVSIGRLNLNSRKWENEFGREIDPQPTHWRPLPLAPNGMLNHGER